MTQIDQHFCGLCVLLTVAGLLFATYLHLVVLAAFATFDKGLGLGLLSPSFTCRSTTLTLNP